MTLKNRNFINVAGVLALVIICLFAFSSCFHEHTFGEWSYAVLPTCTEAGVQSHMCTGCDLTEEMPAEPLGHDEVQHDAVAATCTEKGNEAYVTCSRCDYTTIKETEALGHKEVQCKGKDATCTEKGYEPYVFCERCEYRTFKEIPALGHDEIKHERKQSTCLEKGWTEYVTCSRCDYTTFKELPLSGHQQAVLAAKQPTCTETGLTIGSYCKVCNATIRAQTVVAAKGHSCKQGICKICGAEDFIEPDQYASRLYYDALLRHPKGVKLQKLYDMIYDEARKFHLDYSINLSQFTSHEFSSGFLPVTLNISYLYLTIEEVDIVRNAFEVDNPIFYWFVHIPYQGYATSTKTVKTINIVASYDYLKGEARRGFNEKIAEVVKHYYTNAMRETSNYQKALYIYCELIDKTYYALDGAGKLGGEYEWTQNIIGALCYNSTVCAGYGRSFAMLLNFCGVEARAVLGLAPTDGHLWTLARMDDGNWYWFDPTWDDPFIYFTKPAIHYFCVNDTQKLDWQDRSAPGGSMGLGTETFLTKHIIDDAVLPTRFKNFYIPERSPVKFSSPDVLELRETFTVDGMTYALVGYREVQLVKVDSTPDVLRIPQNVVYNGVDYTVVSTGALLINGLFDGSQSIMRGYAKSVIIPKTVDLVMACSICDRGKSVNMFYDGSAADWENVEYDTYYFNKSKVYFYSEVRPNASGNYWHYVNGVATPW